MKGKIGEEKVEELIKEMKGGDEDMLGCVEMVWEEGVNKGIKEGKKFQTLLGVTGSGKTFTMANIIEKVQKPTLILAHNKTLAGQLYSEFKE